MIQNGSFYVPMLLCPLGATRLVHALSQEEESRQTAWQLCDLIQVSGRGTSGLSLLGRGMEDSTQSEPPEIRTLRCMAMWCHPWVMKQRAGTEPDAVVNDPGTTKTMTPHQSIQ